MLGSLVNSNLLVFNLFTSENDYSSLDRERDYQQERLILIRIRILTGHTLDTKRNQSEDMVGPHWRQWELAGTRN